ncbi:hypothetical protein [Sphingobium aquiterrae]|uniref:hypothetical protein n=1 Tax=Sphingobium aquiterrae TaxID=2038656 RepID=UPI00301687BF
MFELRIITAADTDPVIHAIDTDDEQAAIGAARLLIAEAMGRPGSFVSMASNGRFTAGAGLWSRSGYYTLTPRASLKGKP